MAGRKRRVPDLLDYSDYRKYLKDYYAFRKAGDRGFSYGVFAKRAGIPARGHLKAVLDYGLKLTPETFAKYRKALGLTGEAGEHFGLLVAFNQAEGAKDRETARAALKLWRVEHTFKRVSASEADEIFSTCARFLIRLFSSSPGFRRDPGWISRRLHGLVTPEEAGEALTHLKRHGPVGSGATDVYQENEFMDGIRRHIYRAALHRRARRMGYGGTSNLHFLYLTKEQAVELDRKINDLLKANYPEPSRGPGVELCVAIGDVFALSGPV